MEYNKEIYGERVEERLNNGREGENVTCKCITDQLLTKKAYVPLFGMFVGLGEMIGSLVAGKGISNLGMLQLLNEVFISCFIMFYQVL